MPASGLSERVNQVRRFNRFYTKQIGILSDAYLQSPFTVTEARVVYELAHHGQTTATELGTELGLDAGQLSRILRGLKRRGYIDKTPSGTDGRRSVLRLTAAKGQNAFATINARSHNGIERMLRKLSPHDQERVVEAMSTIERLLATQPEHKVPYILRPPQPGDMGWVVSRHGAIYAEEYRWDESFEALVAGIVAKFMEHYDPKRERCWIAEKDGQNIGSVFLVKKSAKVAKLRLLLVEPHARGLGVGKRLVAECERFARQVGYKKITLWTNSVLTSARHVYEQAGYELVASDKHHSFGHDLVGETWELKL